MPIWMPIDTRAVLGGFANKCESRSLLQERFVFFDTGFNEARRLALDLWVDNVDDQPNDISLLAAKAAEEASKLQTKLNRPDLNSAKRAGIERDLTKQRSLQNLCIDLLKGRSPWRTYPPCRQWVQASGQNSRSFKLPTLQRLAVGLANGVVENAGLTIHRRFGYPIIPGSAVKGLAADGAADLQADAELRRVVLGAEEEADGSTGQAGAISFLDAVAEEAKVELDILTPHYSRYYGGTQNLEALDVEPPVPNVFPVVAAGAKFSFDLLLVARRSLGRFQAKEVLDDAQKWLAHALRTFGIGGKTRAGYGRFGSKTATAINMDLFPDLVAMIDLAAVSDKATVDTRTPVEKCLAHWKGNVSTASLSRLVPDLAALKDDDLRHVVPHLFAKYYLMDDNTPANPQTSPFWQEFSKVAGGAALLSRLTRKPA
jgi:CRISPR type III-B/RAMP module RAMP protein Cmr6